MTDTRVLDAMMDTLRRNPLDPARLVFPDKQFEATDTKPFYAKREVVRTRVMNPNYREIVERFHDRDRLRMERPRRGACRNCGSEVHAVETKQNGAVRVDGRCVSCGWTFHRAGAVLEEG